MFQMGLEMASNHNGIFTRGKDSCIISIGKVVGMKWEICRIQLSIKAEQVYVLPSETAPRIGKYRRKGGATVTERDQ